MKCSGGIKMHEGKKEITTKWKKHEKTGNRKENRKALCYISQHLSVKPDP